MALACEHIGARRRRRHTMRSTNLPLAHTSAGALHRRARVGFTTRLRRSPSGRRRRCPRCGPTLLPYRAAAPYERCTRPSFGPSSRCTARGALAGLGSAAFGPARQPARSKAGEPGSPPLLRLSTGLADRSRLQKLKDKLGGDLRPRHLRGRRREGDRRVVVTLLDNTSLVEGWGPDDLNDGCASVTPPLASAFAPSGPRCRPLDVDRTDETASFDVEMDNPQRKTVFAGYFKD